MKFESRPSSVLNFFTIRAPLTASWLGRGGMRVAIYNNLYSRVSHHRQEEKDPLQSCQNSINNVRVASEVDQ